MSKQKGPGRPSKSTQSEASREQLISAAAHLFAAEGFDKVSIRALGEAANVTPAMISYYFDDKAGLLEAVLMDVLDKVCGMIERVFSAEKSREKAAERPLVADFIEEYLKIIGHSPWIPPILVREVLSKDTPLRTLFQEQFVARVWPLMQPRLMHEIQSGSMRADLDPRYTLLSLIGMCVFPYIAEPALGPVIGFTLDDAFTTEYTKHTQKLFLQGAAPLTSEV